MLKKFFFRILCQVKPQKKCYSIAHLITISRNLNILSKDNLRGHPLKGILGQFKISQLLNLFFLTHSIEANAFQWQLFYEDKNQTKFSATFDFHKEIVTPKNGVRLSGYSSLKFDLPYQTFTFFCSNARICKIELLFPH